MLHDAPAGPTPGPRDRGTAGAPGGGPLVEDLPAALLRPGAWSLGDSAWGVALLDLADPAAAERLTSLGPVRTSDSARSALEAKALAWLRKSPPSRHGACRVYRFEAGDVRVRAVTRGQGEGERIQLAQVVWKRPGGTPQLLEIAPAPADRPTNGEGHLLPVSAGVASLARRWDGAGQLSCEILGPAAEDECLRDWSAAGWTAERLPGTDAPLSLVVLRNGDRVVHLCSVPDGSRGRSAYLLLTAQPAEH
jgi:hypothetical protein